jgi:hypothetical protein
MNQPTVQLHDRRLLGVLDVAVRASAPCQESALAATLRQPMRTLDLPEVASFQHGSHAGCGIAQHLEKQTPALQPAAQPCGREEAGRRGQSLLAGRRDDAHGVAVAGRLVGDVDDRLLEPEARGREVALRLAGEVRAPNHDDAVRGLDMAVALDGHVD